MRLAVAVCPLKSDSLVLLACDVIAKESRDRAVAADRHHDRLRYARPDQIPNSGTAEIVEKGVRAASVSTSSLPQLPPIPDGFSSSMEDEPGECGPVRRLKLPLAPHGFHQAGKIIIEWKNAPAAILGIVESDLAGLPVDLLPCQRFDLALSPGRGSSKER